MGADEAGTLERLKHLHKELVQPKITTDKGRIVKLMGDGLLAEFASVVEAVHCALDIQSEMSQHDRNRPDIERIRLRIGINLGDIIFEDDDIYGDGVNVAARLEALAEPGGICLSGDAFRQVRGKFSVEFEDLGDQDLKNVAEPVQVYRVAAGHFTTIAPQPKAKAPLLPDKPSVAVLPFTNMSGDPDQEYFSDGITEDIITELARNRGLFVMARNSSFAFKGQAVDIAEVGRKLGVRYVVEGSVRKAGNRVRITAQLIEAATGSHVWAERYDSELEDIFAVQDEVTQSISAAVPGQLESDIVKASRRKPTESLDAYDHFLRGKELLNGWRDDDLPQAIAEFERAVKLDPTFARAHASLGCMLVRTWWRTHASHDLEAAAKETELGVRYDGADSECLGWRAFVLLFQRDFDGALDTFDRAMQLKPEDPDLSSLRACCLVFMGQTDDAIETIRRAMRANPHFPPWYHEIIGMAFMTARRHEEAVKSFQAIRVPSYEIHVFTAGCLAELGRLDEARACIRKAYELMPDWAIENIAIEWKSGEDQDYIRGIATLALDAFQQGL
jgi:TolB-like protein/Flp pilus assembly protein TadD